MELKLQHTVAVLDIPNFHIFLEYENRDGNVCFLAEYKVEPV